MKPDARAPLPQPTNPPGRPAIGRIPILGVGPAPDGGRYPAKAVVGEAIVVTATVFREGHDAVAATACLTRPDGTPGPSAPMRPLGVGLDRWIGEVVPDCEGPWTFHVEGWSDPYATWRHDAEIKVPAGLDTELMFASGAQVLERAAAAITSRAKAASEDAAHLRAAASALHDTSRPDGARLAAGVAPEVVSALGRHPLRELVTPSEPLRLTVQRERMLVGAWYEVFPRSLGAHRFKNGKWRTGTLRSATKGLDRIAEMGFDVVYLTPVHPIGTTNRKGPNNTLTCRPDDPGSPYAIGSPDGGHDAIHPELGGFKEFDALARRARALGMEVALDLALQCSPDHPWLTEHPEWFTTRVDGTIAYAENPPKKYQDIYPLNFDNDPEGIYQEILRIIRLWIDHGVTIFRVDNPHTKPLPFWERLLAEVAAERPDVIFLAEAFTRPAMMHALAMIGFQQSYTYFAWRNSKQELEEYLTEVSGEAGSYMRPSFWPTTHDILTPYMQTGGPAAFAIRAVLAATGSPTYGIYSGYEFHENVARPGAEEQIDNEKYEFKERDYASDEAQGMTTLLTRLNEIRREHVALRRLRNLTIHPTSDDATLCFSKRVPAHLSPDGEEDTIIVVVNLDPHATREATVYLDFDALGLRRTSDPHAPVFVAHDLLSGATYGWGAEPYVRIDPYVQCAHIIEVRSL